MTYHGFMWQTHFSGNMKYHSYLHIAQWAFNPHKMSLWGRGSKWVLSSFRYTFIHYFSYKISLFFAFFHLKCTETFQSFSKYVHRNSWFSEGWTVLTETIVIVLVKCDELWFFSYAHFLMWCFVRSCNLNIFFCCCCCLLLVWFGLLWKGFV